MTIKKDFKFTLIIKGLFCVEKPVLEFFYTKNITCMERSFNNQ